MEHPLESQLEADFDFQNTGRCSKLIDVDGARAQRRVKLISGSRSHKPPPTTTSTKGDMESTNELKRKQTHF